MSLTEDDENRYAALAAAEENHDGTSTAGRSAHGQDAADIGQALLENALGGPEQVERAVGGRPRVGGGVAGAGASNTLQTRISGLQREQVDELREQLGLKTDSEVVRAALDEFAAQHLRPTA